MTETTELPSFRSRERMTPPLVSGQDYVRQPSRPHPGTRLGQGGGWAVG